MYASVPGHMVIGVMRGFASASLDMPKSVTLALFLALVNGIFPWCLSLLGGGI